MSRRLSIILLFTVFLLSAYAQNSSMRQIYDQAESDYQDGRIEQAVELLEDNIKSFPANLKVSVYRLLSLCNLALDKEMEAEQYATLMLREDPYYNSSLQDPLRFSELVSNIKVGLTATITTASAQSEDLREVPVPTTLITEEMIRDCGARNLQEVLACYVPGISIIDSNEGANIAMRGIYSYNQEKILIMINGHRINSYSTNIAAPDFSMSLEKLKQIEVLRGPASSIYGGVALTAVVNLITKQGIDIDGIKARVGIGNYGQIQADVNGGKRFFDLDFAIWGSLYKANGQKIYVDKEDTGFPLETNGGDVYVGAFGNKPSYDFGTTLKWNDLQMMYSSRFTEAISPFTASYTFHPYNIDKYQTFKGIRPSTTSQTHHIEISYLFNSEYLFLRGAVTYDNNDLTRYQVFSEEPIALGGGHPIPYESNLGQLMAKYPGVFRYLNGQEKTLGFQLKGDVKYINNGVHKGSVAFGAEYSRFKFDDMRYTIGYNYTQSDTLRLPKDIGKGNENSFSSFVQLKHQWKSLILNAGLRYDYKDRYDNSRIYEYSPRLSLIYLRPQWNAKISYSKSFIDAPYLYRKMNDALYQLRYSTEVSDDKMTPEYLHSMQFTLGGTEWVRGLNLELNAFYNHAKDLIYVKTIDYENLGEYKSWGVEFSGSYRQKRFYSNLNFTWQTATFVRIFDFEKELSRIPNIPDFMANAVLAWNATKNLRLYTHLSFYSKQTAYIADMDNMVLEAMALDQYENAETEEERRRLAELVIEIAQKDIRYIDVSPRFLCDVGAEYTIWNLQFRLNMYNLFNKKYHQSGQGTGLVPQRGRWFMFSVGIKI